MTVTLTGFMGCGKSSVGRELSTLSGRRFIDLDDYITAKAGRSIAEIFKEGESVFRALERECLEEILQSGEDVILALGGGTFCQDECRRIILEKTESWYLRCPFDTLIGRLKRSPSVRPKLNFDTVEDLYDSRTPIYELAAHTIDTAGLSPRQTASLIAGI